MKNVLLIFLLGFFPLTIAAQASQSTDLIFLKDGSTIRGTVLEQIPDEYIKVRISGGTEIEVRMSAIKRIKTDKEGYIFNADGSNYRQRGFYTNLQVQGMFGKAADSEQDQRLALGLGVQYAMGHQFNKYFAAGAGVGLRLYDNIVGDAFVQMRGFYPLGKFSPMVTMETGYGVPLVLSGGNSNFEQIRGGWSLRPSIGVRIATRNRADITVDAGYQFQQAHNTTNWGWGTINEFRVWYKRLSFRIGWNF